MAFQIKGGQKIKYLLNGDWHIGKVKEVDKHSNRFRVILNPGDKAGQQLRWFTREEIRIQHGKKKTSRRG